MGFSMEFYSKVGDCILVQQIEPWTFGFAPAAFNRWAAHASAAERFSLTPFRRDQQGPGACHGPKAWGLEFGI